IKIHIDTEKKTTESILVNIYISSIQVNRNSEQEFKFMERNLSTRTRSLPTRDPCQPGSEPGLVTLPFTGRLSARSINKMVDQTVF
ncbi:MAG: hypothetical protein ACTHZ1_10535, partial [Sphingobacterium sp.]